MPTGYTYLIEENPEYTFNQFVWDCARAFGALMHMREDATDATVRAMEVEPYYMESVERARENLETAKAMTLDEATTRLEALKAEIHARREKDRLEQETQAKRYQAMKAQVEAWTPPTPDHEPLKTFMLEQIAASIRPPVPYVDIRAFYASPEEYRTDALDGAVKDITHANERLARHLEVIHKANKWVSDLTISVGPPGK